MVVISWQMLQTLFVGGIKVIEKKLNEGTKSYKDCA